MPDPAAPDLAVTDLAVPDLAVPDSQTHTPVAPDVCAVRTGIVNVVLLGPPGAGDRGWVLVDAGLPGSAGHIRRAAAARFGPDARPAAIVLTHGHLDHIGALRALADRWDAPVYAHPLELPYLTGRSAYPPPDPTVGGGAMPLLSVAFLPGPFDFGDRVRALPAGGAVPGAPGWTWLHTPGHTPGHVSLWRAADRTLVAGDAFVTTKQESLWAALTQRVELHGPPTYYTPDWPAARASLEALAALGPAAAVTGHGRPRRGEALRSALDRLAAEFDARAVPPRGRYVGRPAVADAEGVVWTPPRPPAQTAALALGAALAAGWAARRVLRPRG